MDQRTCAAACAMLLSHCRHLVEYLIPLQLAEVYSRPPLTTAQYDPSESEIRTRRLPVV